MSVFSITGRLGADCELRQTQKGTKVAQFTVAEDRGYGDRKETIWVKCALFGERAEKIAPYLTKGTMVEAWGQISASAFKGKDGNPRASLDLNVQEIKLHGGGRKDQPVADNTRSAAAQPNDEIPW